MTSLVAPENLAAPATRGGAKLYARIQANANTEDLFAAHAIGERAAQMRLEFVRPV